jgi:hypothetical protein
MPNRNFVQKILKRVYSVGVKLGLLTATLAFAMIHAFSMWLNAAHDIIFEEIPEEKEENQSKEVC